MPVKKVPLGVMGPFYVFNMVIQKYTKGSYGIRDHCSGYCPNKGRPKVASLLPALTQITIDQ